MKKLMLFTAVLFALAAGVVYAGESFEFASAAIRSLELASNTRETLSPPEKLADETNTKLVLIGAMTDIQIAMRKIETAESLIRPFTKSKDENTRISALGFDAAYLLLIKAFNGSLSTMDKFVNLGCDMISSQWGTFSRQFSEHLVAADEAWKMLLDCAVGVTHILVDEDRLEEGKICYLTITSAEKKMLLEELNGFGDSIKHGPKAGQHPTEAAPAVLWKFLNKGWKPSDSN